MFLIEFKDKNGKRNCVNLNYLIKQIEKNGNFNLGIDGNNDEKLDINKIKSEFNKTKKLLKDSGWDSEKMAAISEASQNCKPENQKLFNQIFKQQFQLIKDQVNHDEVVKRSKRKTKRKNRILENKFKI